MPGRRPYAYRGVARRATARQPGRAMSLVGLCVLVVVGVLLVGGVGLAASSFVFGQHGLAAPVAGDSTASDVLRTGGGDASSLQMADVNTPVAAAAAADVVNPSPSPTPVALLRQWDASGSNITVDPALVGRLDQALIGVAGHVSVAVKDLGSGRGAVLDGDQELAAASLYKLPVLYTVFDSGISLTESMPISEQALSYDSGTMELGAGETLTVAELVERMVTLSDNTSAVMLGDLVGAARVNASIAALGMDTTHYSLERMTTSALDMLHLLDLVARGKAVSPAASADMLHLLLRQRVNDRLPRLLPDDAQVAHKTGNLPGTVNDVGIIYGPSSTVAVAALISDTPDETAAATGIARVAQAAYAYFEDQPEDANRPLIPSPPARPIPPVHRVPHPVATPTPTLETSAGAGVQAPTATPLLVESPSTPGATPGPATPATLRPTTSAAATQSAGTATPKPTVTPPTVAQPTVVALAQPTATPPPPAPPTAAPRPATPTPAPPPLTAPPTRAPQPATPVSTPAKH